MIFNAPRSPARFKSLPDCQFVAHDLDQVPPTPPGLLLDGVPLRRQAKTRRPLLSGRDAGIAEHSGRAGGVCNHVLV
jgi:hypothetical protein